MKVSKSRPIGLISLLLLTSATTSLPGLSLIHPIQAISPARVGKTFLPRRTVETSSTVQTMMGRPDPASAKKGLGASSQAERREAYGKLPLSFEANLGQTNEDVKFLSRGGDFGLYLTLTEAVMVVTNPAKHHAQVNAPDNKVAVHPQWPSADSVLRMRLLNANPRPGMAGLDELPGKSNYFIGPPRTIET